MQGLSLLVLKDWQKITTRVKAYYREEGQCRSTERWWLAHVSPLDPLLVNGRHFYLLPLPISRIHLRIINNSFQTINTWKNF